MRELIHWAMNACPDDTFKINNFFWKVAEAFHHHQADLLSQNWATSEEKTPTNKVSKNLQNNESSKAMKYPLTTFSYFNTTAQH